MTFLRFHIRTHRLMWRATLTPEDEGRVENGSFDRPWQRVEDNTRGKAVMLIKDE